MPASDPTTDVPTPTGTLQGVAAFSWDGSAWQPAGRAGPSVATPTGVLRGVAAFNGGPGWQPAAQAQPGVATPTGVLDGVAVYTWSGAAWTPPGGTATPSTPHGALRGVAAFNWDGAAWQPAAQAGPSVATPYGVLDGVAMFGWSGSAWAAVGAPSLSLDFMTPGTLDPRITFARGSTGTYFNSAGVMQTAATNAPRWDYNPSTLALNGLLIEEARTNIWLQSADASNASWVLGGSGAAAPTVTGNQTIAPDGTMTAARVAFPAVSGANVYSLLVQSPAGNANPFSFSVWMKGNAGGEQLYVATTVNGASFYRILATLTTTWQRFTLITPALTVASWFFEVGVDLRDGGQASKPAQTVFIWGAQVEQGAFPTSYIPTTATAVTRAIDQCSMPTAAWFSAAAISIATDTIVSGVGSGGFAMMYVLNDGSTNNRLQQLVNPGNAAQSVVSSAGVNSVVLPEAATVALSAPFKFGASLVAGTFMSCLNGATPYSNTTAIVMPAGVNRLDIGGITGSYALNGYMRRLRYWPRALSAAELQSVTT